MKTIFALAVLLTAVCLAACATVGGPSLFDDGQSPRRSTVAAIEEVVIPTLDRLTAAAPVLPAPFLDDVDQFASEAERIATRYLDATEACVVIDGGLQTDTSVGRGCDGAALMRAFGDVRDLIDLAIKRADVDTARGLVVVSLFLPRTLAPSSGDIISGYEKREDISREIFASTRGELRKAFDRFRAAAADALAARAAPR